MNLGQFTLISFEKRASGYYLLIQSCPRIIITRYFSSLIISEILLQDIILVW